MALAYRFGDFRIVPATRELWRGDAPVAVSPRAFDCIVYLLEHRERAVGRDELIAAVWGRTETGDGTLGQTVLAARRALDDTGKEQHAIRTVFRFGYHWVAPVEVADEAPTTVPAEEAPPPADPAAARTDAPALPPPRRPVVKVVAAGLAIVLVLVFVAIVQRQHRVAPQVPGAGASHGAIALVLPVTVSAGSGYDWVRLGLMDLIGARLRAAGLAVVPSDNVVALTGRLADDANPDAIARAAGATLVIEPYAESIEGRWRVTLKTTRGRDPPLSATGESADVLAAARSAADDLARQLGHAPVASASADDDPLALARLSQEIEAARLNDRLDTARALLDRNPHKMAEPLDYILSLAETGLTEMRSLIFELRPEALETEGLVNALMKQAKAVQIREGLQVAMELGTEPELPFHVKEALYRVVQEAIQNSVKHAHAQKITVRLSANATGSFLDVIDDGVGFNPDQPFPQHLGLLSMHERVALLGGSLTITSSPGMGTRVHVIIPARLPKSVADGQA